jgi:YVTN family beta-propeller protein
VGLAPQGVAVHPNGKRVYVTNKDSKTVSVIDTEINLEIGTIPVQDGPEGIVVNANGTLIYVANSGSNTVSVIDTASNQTLTTIPVGVKPIGIALHPNEAYLYVANNGSNTVAVIDTLTNTVIATIGVGVNPFGIAVNPAGTRVYTANSGNHTAAVINTLTNTVLATVPVDQNPLAFGQFVGPILPVAAPTFNPGSGSYSTPQAVTISSASEGSLISYTTDGSTPTAIQGTTIGNGQFVTIGTSSTLKAIAYKDGWAESAVSEAHYLIGESNDDGGGCTIGSNRHLDLTLPALALISLVYLLRRRRAVR